MNKTDAAIFLGVGLRTLERYTQNNRIPSRKVKGAGKPVVDYAESDLIRLKAELDVERTITTSATISPTKSPDDSPESTVVYVQPSATKPPAENEAGIESSTALAIIPARNSPRSLAKIPATNPPEFVPIAQKKLLTIFEAAALTGFSTNFIRESIKTGDLEAKQVKRIWRIKPANLDLWIDKVA